MDDEDFRAYSLHLLFSVLPSDRFSIEVNKETEKKWNQARKSVLENLEFIGSETASRFKKVYLSQAEFFHTPSAIQNINQFQAW